MPILLHLENMKICPSPLHTIYCNSDTRLLVINKKITATFKADFKVLNITIWKKDCAY